MNELLRQKLQRGWYLNNLKVFYKNKYKGTILLIRQAIQI
jgi:hypothetical protein